MSEYEPVDDTIEKQYGKWKASEAPSDANIPVGHEILDNGEGEGRKFEANQLIVGDSEIERIKDLLESNDVRFKADKYLEPHTSEDGITAPGEYVLTLSDPKEIKPASPDYVDQVVGLLQTQEIGVRYGNKNGAAA